MHHSGRGCCKVYHCYSSIIHTQFDNINDFAPALAPTNFISIEKQHEHRL